tara:strand:+ start:210 stop:557 length:348 start_codon:yes stop_codon:yes gene_type:complete
MSKAALICGWSLAVLFGYFTLDKSLELHRAKLYVQLADQENSLLEDQIADMQMQMPPKRTYDDGFRDAMIRKQSVEYVNGYHAAMEQLLDACSMPEEELAEKLLVPKPEVNLSKK